MLREIQKGLDKVITVHVDSQYTLLNIGEQRGTSTKVALLHRQSRFQPFIVAWNYDVNTGEWGQGHYFENRNDAYLVYMNYIDRG